MNGDVGRLRSIGGIGDVGEMVGDVIAGVVGW